MKVGRIPVAVGLIGYGAALALDNLKLTTNATDVAIRFWPLLLIAAGLEYLWFARDESRRNAGFDIGGAILLIVVVAVTSSLRWAPFSFGFGFSSNETKTVHASSSAAGVKELRVKTGVGRIELDPGTDTIHVEATVSGRQGTDDLEDLQVLISPGSVAEISISSRANRSLPVTYRIRAPQGLKVVAESGTGAVTVSGYDGELVLRSGTGRTEVESGAGSLQVNGGTGSISVTNFRGNVALHSTTGSVRTDRTTGDLQIKGSTSSVTATDFRGGSVDITTTTGSIRAESDEPLAGDVRLRATTGSVTLRVPPTSSMRVNARTTTGGLSGPDFLKVSRSGSSRSGQGTLGSGTYDVDLNVTTGSISVKH